MRTNRFEKTNFGKGLLVQYDLQDLIVLTHDKDSGRAVVGATSDHGFW